MKRGKLELEATVLILLWCDEGLKRDVNIATGLWGSLERNNSRRDASWPLKSEMPAVLEVFGQRDQHVRSHRSTREPSFPRKAPSHEGPGVHTG